MLVRLILEDGSFYTPCADADSFVSRVEKYKFSRKINEAVGYVLDPLNKSPRGREQLQLIDQLGNPHRERVCVYEWDAIKDLRVIE